MSTLLHAAVAQQASDLHLSAGLPPTLRIHGDLKPLDTNPLEKEAVQTLLYGIMSSPQQQAFAQGVDIDFSFAIDQLARFRVHAFHQARGPAAALRVIPQAMQTLDQLGLPAVVKEITQHQQGLVLVTGPTGSGKSTTLAAMVEYINQHQAKHIVTIEDPMEYVHANKKSIINQREVYTHTPSFHAALRSALRQDPDIILVGELRDTDTIRLALTAAETGHLVLASLHSNSACATIHRIIDVFPGAEKNTVRTLLSEALQAVIAQHLVQKIDGVGRVAAVEIMRCTHAIRNLIREDKIAQMISSLQTGQAKGMQTLDQHVLQLIRQGIISKDAGQELSKGYIQ